MTGEEIKNTRKDFARLRNLYGYFIPLMGFRMGKVYPFTLVSIKAKR